MGYIQKPAQLGDAGRRRLGLGSAAGSLSGRGRLGFVPAVVLPQAASIVSGILHIGGGANPNIRPGNKALIDFLFAAGDVDGLNHIINATQSSGAKVYPTAAIQYAQSALAQVGTVTPASVNDLRTLANAYLAFPLPGQGSPDRGTGQPYLQWETDRVNLDLNRATVTSGGPVSLPQVATTTVTDQATQALRQAVAQGLVDPTDAQAVRDFALRVAGAAGDVSTAATGARIGARAGAATASFLGGLPTWALVLAGLGLGGAIVKGFGGKRRNPRRRRGR